MLHMPSVNCRVFGPVTRWVYSYIYICGIGNPVQLREQIPFHEPAAVQGVRDLANARAIVNNNKPFGLCSLSCTIPL